MTSKLWCFSPQVYEGPEAFKASHVWTSEWLHSVRVKDRSMTGCFRFLNCSGCCVY